MIIENLVYQVSPSKEAKNFIDADAEVWDPWLKQQPGFIKKQASHKGNGQVTLTIFWRSRQDLDKAGAKKDEMGRLDAEMRDKAKAQARLLIAQTF